ncbi:MAG: ankyrin repeat domain-containing protein [Acidobacteria bacterium]|nr:ankyrin repeat domain-containing protein [Acidobacteriota bacterium]
MRSHNDWTPLHWAAAQGDAPSVELLLAHRADPARTYPSQPKLKLEAVA